MVALEVIPAKVRATSDASWQEINFLPDVLAHISNVQIARKRIEREAPGVAQTISPDFCAASAGSEGVIWRDGVGLAAIHINTQELA